MKQKTPLEPEGNADQHSTAWPVGLEAWLTFASGISIHISGVSPNLATQFHIQTYLAFSRATESSEVLGGSLPNTSRITFASKWRV